MIKRTAVIWLATWTSLTLLSTPLALGVEAQAQLDTHSPAHAQAVSATQTLLSLSGLNDQLDALPGAVRSSFEQLLIAEGVAAPFETDDIPQLRHAVGSVFNAQSLQLSLLTELDTTLESGDRQRLINFYNTDIGIELRNAEMRNSILDNEARFEEWYENTGLYALVPERQVAIEALEQSMQATNGAVDAMVGMQIAMQISLTPILPAAEQLSPSQLMTLADQMRPDLTRMYYESSLQTLAFVFQDQSLAVLNAYTAELNTLAGQRFVKGVNDGLTRGLFDSAEKLGVLLQDILVTRLGQGA